MTVLVLGFSIVAVFAVAGAAGESGMSLVNAAWLDDKEKFRLVSRWGSRS